MSVRLRMVRWPDLSALADLERRIFPVDAWSEATLWAELAQRPRRSYVLLEGMSNQDGRSTILGYAGLDLAGESADVMTLAVDPTHRGNGHGLRLLQQLHEAAASGGARHVLLEVRADSNAARGLYDRLGYTEVHRRTGYYHDPGGQPVDAVVMRHELTGRP